MDSWQLLLLAFVQGVTEFLPVSSSGHLVILQTWIGLREPPLIFDLVLHGGTLVAVLIYFRRELGALLAGVLGASDQRAGALRFAALVVAGSVPTAIIGLGIEEYAASAFASRQAAAAGLLITALLLLLGAHRLRSHRPAAEEQPEPITAPGNLTLATALVVGVIQGIAVFPGISRSGSTIVAGLLMGLSASSAFRFSFLLSIPAVAGALVLKAPEVSQAVIEGGSLPGYLVGALVAAVIGYGSIALLSAFIRKQRLAVFAVYCALAGALVLAIG